MSGDLESIFHHCGVPVKFVQPSSCVRKDIGSCFHHCGGPVKLVQATLCVRKDIGSSFHHCGGREDCSCQFECRKGFRKEIISRDIITHTHACLHIAGLGGMHSILTSVLQLKFHHAGFQLNPRFGRQTIVN